MLHIAPKEKSNRYIQVNQCINCRAIGTFTDMCPACGSAVKNNKCMGKWNAPVYKWLGLKVDVPGYWSLNWKK